MSTYQEAVKEHGGVKQAARAYGIPPSTFRDRMVKEKAGEPVAPLKEPSRQTGRPSPSRPRLSTLSERELLATHDPYEKARANMEQIPSLIEPGRFIKDYEMRKAVGLSGESQLFRDLAEDPEMGLTDYQFCMGNRSKAMIYWTDPETKARVLKDRPLIAHDVVPSAEED